MSELVLSLFPGIDLLGRGFEEEGFTVVRGPDLLWGGDVRTFHPPPGRFDGVIGGPPCQVFSPLQRMNRYTTPENLIPEFERCVAEAAPAWFVMENVRDAPVAQVDGFETATVLLNNRSIGGIQERARRFTLGRAAGPVRWDLGVDLVALEPIDRMPTVTANGSRWDADGTGKRRRGRAWSDKSTRYLRDAIRAQGLPEDFELPGMTVRGAIRAVGNAVPLPMARAVARAVQRALASDEERAA